MATNVSCQFPGVYHFIKLPKGNYKKDDKAPLILEAYGHA